MGVSRVCWGEIESAFLATSVIRSIRNSRQKVQTSTAWRHTLIRVVLHITVVYFQWFFVESRHRIQTIGISCELAPCYIQTSSPRTLDPQISVKMHEFVTAQWQSRRWCRFRSSKTLQEIAPGSCEEADEGFQQSCTARFLAERSKIIIPPYSGHTIRIKTEICVHKIISHTTVANIDSMTFQGPSYKKVGS